MDAAVLGAKSHPSYPTLVAGKRLQFLAGCRIPDDCRVISTSRSNQTTIWAKSYRLNFGAMPLSVSSSLPVEASQILAVPSWLPVATRLPSGL